MNSISLLQISATDPHGIIITVVSVLVGFASLAILHISYYLIGIPFAYFAGTSFGWGPVGVWLGLLLGLMLAAILYVYRFNKLTKNFTTNE